MAVPVLRRNDERAQRLADRLISRPAEQPGRQTVPGDDIAGGIDDNDGVEHRGVERFDGTVADVFAMRQVATRAFEVTQVNSVRRAKASGISALYAALIYPRLPAIALRASGALIAKQAVPPLFRPSHSSLSRKSMSCSRPSPKQPPP